MACARFDQVNIDKIADQGITTVEDAYYRVLQTRQKGRRQVVPVLHKASTKTTHLHIIWICANASRKCEYQRDTLNQAFGISDKKDLKKHIDKSNQTVYQEDNASAMETLFLRLFLPQSFDVHCDLSYGDIDNLESHCRENKNPRFFRLLRQYLEKRSGPCDEEYVCDGQKPLITQSVQRSSSTALVVRQPSDSPALSDGADDISDQKEISLPGKFCCS